VQEKHFFSEEIVCGIQEQLEERIVKYDDMVNKHVMLEKELMTLKKTYESKRRADKKSIAALEKRRDHNRMKLEVKKREQIG
jgi:hypothetical protein